MEYIRIPRNSVPNAPSPELRDEEIDLGTLPSPSNRDLRPSLSHTRNESGGSSLTAVTYFDHPTPSLNPSPEEDKDDESAFKKKWLKEWWFWEMGGCLVSIGCMAVILVLIPKFHGEPLVTWRFRMSPNTSISTLITVAKTAMLLPVAECIRQLKWRHFWIRSRPLAEIEAFDDASRGPFGAFIFAWKTRLTSRIALLGSFIMVGALTMEPLAQQIVSVEMRYRKLPSSELPELNVSRIYVAQAYNREFTMDERNKGFATAHSIQGAFLTGVYNTPLGVRVSCANGNCTWPDFLTLGVCSWCEDSTEQSGPKCLNSTDEACVTKNYTFPRHTNFTDGTDFIVTADNGSGNGDHLVKSQSYRSIKDVEGTDWWNSRGILTRFILGRFRDYLTLTEVNIPDHVTETKPELTSCDFSWCARLYRNFTHQNKTESYLGFTPYEYESWGLPLKRQPSPDSNTVAFGFDMEAIHKNYDFTEDQLDKTYDTTFGVPQNGQRVFEVSKADYLVTSNFLANMMTMELKDTPFDRAHGSFVNSKFEQIFGRALLNSRNISHTVENIAFSISTRIPLFQDVRNKAHHRFVEADAIVPEAIVVMRKRWFAFPASLVLLSLVFLIATLFVNHSANTPSWKSSSLPLLFHGIEGWSEYNDEELKNMAKQAQRMWAKLEKNPEENIKLLKH